MKYQEYWTYGPCFRSLSDRHILDFPVYVYTQVAKQGHMPDCWQRWFILISHLYEILNWLLSVSFLLHVGVFSRARFRACILFYHVVGGVTSWLSVLFSLLRLPLIPASSAVTSSSFLEINNNDFNRLLKSVWKPRELK